MRTKEELLQVNLPKWSQCLIKGTKISEEQALEIIRRTDSFLCNQPYVRDKDVFGKWVVDTLQIPCEYSSDDYEEMKFIYDCYKKWANHFGCIELNYLHNDWIYSSFVGGNIGWCHPDGIIEYHYNIGKWPTTEEVLDDLSTIVSNFPFLDFTCTLMDAEYLEDRKPLVSFIVKDGHANISEPIEIDELELLGKEDDEEVKANFLQILMSGDYAHSIPKEVIESWIKFVE